MLHRKVKTDYKNVDKYVSHNLTEMPDTNAMAALIARAKKEKAEKLPPKTAETKPAPNKERPKKSA